NNTVGIIDKIVSLIVFLRIKFSPHHGLPSIPSRTVVLVQDSRINAIHWGRGQIASKKFLQVVGDFCVTKIGSKEITLVSALFRTKRRLIFPRVTRGDVMVKDLTSVYHGHYPIPAGAITNLGVHFITVPDDGQKPGDLVAGVAVIDQFDNRHWFYGLRFKRRDRMIP
ncbi:MAG TPA: hypothetical protein VED85_04870, partial [Burkholderiaceae bacterium]|nr:hypothetical protein [Burkholderiaceae bacterium]